MSCATNVAVASVFIDGLPAQKPKQILTDQKDRFFVDYGRKIHVITDKPIYSVSISDPTKSYSTGQFDSVVSVDGIISSLIVSSRTQGKSQTTYYRLSIAECKKDKCEYNLLGSWNSGKNSSRYAASKLLASNSGNLFFTVDYTYKSGKKWLSKSTYYVNKKAISKDNYFKKLQQDYPISKDKVVASVGDGPSAFFSNNIAYKRVAFIRDSISLAYDEPRNSRYNYSVVYDNRSSPHIFFHNPEDRSFYHHFYSPEKNKIKEIVVDQAESGIENVAFVNEDAIWSVHYFYRDSFSKGLVATQHDSKTGKILDKFIIDASETRNSGWELMGAQSSKNRILMSYLSNKDTSKREFIVLNRGEDLKNILGHNFLKYGHPRGVGYLKHVEQQKRAEHIAILNESYFKSIRSNYLNIGAGVQYVFWSVTSSEPDEDSNVQNPYMVNYELSSSILNMMTIEGKFGNTNFGLEFATRFFEKKLEDSDPERANQFEKISGKIGWEKLFFDYDFAFQYESTSSKVFFTDKSGQIPSRLFDLVYEEFKFSLLTLKRHHFGYVYQNYNFYQPVYIYLVREGSKSYSFYDQAIGDIDAKNHLFHYGYSTINYLAKYETKAKKWFVDAEGRVGLSLADFKSDSIIADGRKPGTEMTVIGSLQLEVGYVWYKRWKNFNQFGGLIKVSYRLNYSRVGNSNAPEDLEKKSNKDKYLAQFDRTEIRHGPMLFLSLVF